MAKHIDKLDAIKVLKSTFRYKWC